MTLQQGRFMIVPGAARETAPSPRAWQVPVAVGPVGGTAPAKILLLEGNAEIPAESCGEAVKVNLGDVGYYRVEYGPISRAVLAKSLALMRPEDRVNFIADSWAMVQAGRTEAPS